MDLDISSVVACSYIEREARGSSPGSGLYFSVTHVGTPTELHQHDSSTARQAEATV